MHIIDTSSSDKNEPYVPHLYWGNNNSGLVRLKSSDASTPKSEDAGLLIGNIGELPEGFSAPKFLENMFNAAQDAVVATGLDDLGTTLAAVFADKTGIHWRMAGDSAIVIAGEKGIMIISNSQGQTMPNEDNPSNPILINSIGIHSHNIRDIDNIGYMSLQEVVEMVGNNYVCMAMSDGVFHYLKEKSNPDAQLTALRGCHEVLVEDYGVFPKGEKEYELKMAQRFRMFSERDDIVIVKLGGLGLAVAGDGIGGHENGHEASSSAISACRDFTVKELGKGELHEREPWKFSQALER